MRFRQDRRIEARAVIFDRDMESSAIRPGSNSDRRAFARWRHGVLHAVLDKRLQRQPRHQRSAVLRWGLNAKSKTLAESNALDLQVAADEDQFLVQRDEG